MTTFNRSVLDIPLTWNRTQFRATRHKCRLARKLIEISINTQFEKHVRGVFSHNIEIEENINHIDEQLLKYHNKLRVLDNMIELASQSLRIYFDTRMENVRTIINEHCNIIQQIIREEAEHWKEIHSIMDQNLLNPGDIRSRNNYPRAVQKSPASNIATIEEDDNEEHVSKLLNSKTLTPLITQMIRKSRLQSKRLTIVPSVKMNAHNPSEYSLPRKEEPVSIHIVPLSTVRPPLELVDTTFVIKPEETVIDDETRNDDDDDDEPNGTYRDPNQHCHSNLPVTQPETLLIDSQPHMPARLCFSPTILQDGTASPENEPNEQSSSSDNEELNNSPIDQNKTNVIKTIQVTHRFGQTFLLDIVKTEHISNDQTEFIRPTIPDDDVLVISDDNLSERIQHSRQENSNSNANPSIQQEPTTVQETVSTKSQKSSTNKAKSKPTIVSARKTRSATKILAEREAATIKSSNENKRKIRKRKQSKSIDRTGETSNDENENPQSNSSRIITNKRKIKRRRKSKTDNHRYETSDDNHDYKRKTTKRNEHLQEIINNNEINRKTTKKSKRSDMSDSDNDKQMNSVKYKKIKDIEGKKTKTKISKEPNTSDSENERSTISTKRNRSKAPLNDNEEKKAKTKKLKEQDITSDGEAEKRTNSTKNKTNKDIEEKKSKTKKRKAKIKKTKIDDDEQISQRHNTRSSTKRHHRPI